MSYLIDELKFHFLDDFAKWIEKGIAVEWGNIEKRREDGEFAEYEEYEATMDYPLLREQYAAQAILHLLNTLVDEQLRKMVEASVMPAHDPAKPKFHFERIADLRYPEIKSAIEKSYGVELSSLEGWFDYENVRELDNAFKHRSGNKRFKELLDAGESINDVKHEVCIAFARSQIRPCVQLVKELHRISMRVIGCG